MDLDLPVVDMPLPAMQGFRLPLASVVPPAAVVPAHLAGVVAAGLAVPDGDHGRPVAAAVPSAARPGPADLERDDERIVHQVSSVSRQCRHSCPPGPGASGTP